VRFIAITEKRRNILMDEEFLKKVKTIEIYKTVINAEHKQGHKKAINCIIEPIEGEMFCASIPMYGKFDLDNLPDYAQQYNPINIESITFIVGDKTIEFTRTLDKYY
jgi:hypothetical protein